MRIVLLFLVSLFTCQLLYGQTDFTEETPKDSMRIAILDDLDVNRDARLDKMLTNGGDEWFSC